MPNVDRVFDWEKAARLIKQANGKNAYAISLSFTEGSTEILRDGVPVPRQRPIEPLDTRHMVEIGLQIDDRERMVCCRAQVETPGWDGNTYWPMSALAILGFPVFVANWPMPAHMFVFQGWEGCGEKETESPRQAEPRLAENGVQGRAVAELPQVTWKDDGHFCWRGAEIERYEDSAEANQEFQVWAQTIADRCLSLESRGFEVNRRTVMRFNLEFKEAPAGTPWREALCRYSLIFSRGERLRVAFYKKPLRHGVVALEKRGKIVYGEEYDDNSDAIDGILAQGFKLENIEKSYRGLSEIFVRSGLTRNEIRAVLRNAEPGFSEI